MLVPLPATPTGDVVTAAWAAEALTQLATIAALAAATTSRRAAGRGMEWTVAPNMIGTFLAGVSRVHPVFGPLKGGML